MKAAFLFAGLALASVLDAAASQPIHLRDDVKRPVHASRPATRVVTLAPYLTDFVVAVGAAELLVGIAEGSDRPPVMKRPPTMGDVPSFIVEHLESLKPDLVLAFMDDIRPDEVDKISSTGATVFVAGTRTLGDVPALLRSIGLLTGRDASGAAADFAAALAAAGEAHAGKRTFGVFVETWHRPLTTVGAAHFLNEALRICGADNAFKDLPGGTTGISWDQLERRNPVAVIGVGSASSAAEFRSNWEVRTRIAAARVERLGFVDWRIRPQPTPAAAANISRLCEEIDRVRRSIFAAAGARR